MSFLFKYQHEQTSSTVVIDDDDKVCYAYLIEHGRVSADVWLYNVIDTPCDPEWSDKANLPFANSAGYINQPAGFRISNDDDVRIDWIASGTELDRAIIYIHEKIHAILLPGSKPSWCVFSCKANPLAKPLSDFNTN